MRRQAVNCFLSCLLGIAVQASAEAQSADEQFRALVDDHWSYGVASDPLWATYVGDHRFNDQLPDLSLEQISQQQQKREEFLGRMSAIDPGELSDEQRTNYRLFKRQLEDQSSEYRFGSHLIPITGRSGFHIEFPELRRQVPLDNETDYRNYIARLAKFKDYADDHIALMRKGLETGHVLPAIVLEDFERALDAHIVDSAEESLLFEPLRTTPNTIAPATVEKLQQAASEAIMSGIVPGYRRFLDFMRSEYVPRARVTIGASELPDGRDFYRYRVRHFTTLEITPEEVHKIGRDEVARIRSEMEEIVKQVEFEGDLPAFIEDLRTNPKFYAKTPEELMQATALVCKKMDGRLPKLFGKLPRTPYGLRQIPAYIAPRTTTAYYQQPAGDGTRAGFYFVNTYNLKSRPLYGVEALSLHEAVPGHHLQLALQQELEGLPQFRRFSNFTVFIEGWGLYAERLGLEAGFYEDPYSNFGRLTYEMWRACRLVVDTGIHYLGWSRQQAIDYMAANTGLSLHNIRAEVDRYIAWPGQALAYKMGELKIRELRAQAEETLGDAFDIRGFHDVVLGSGAVPLDVLESNVAKWIDAQQ